MGKLKLNKDGLKGMFINHVEKMVLVVVLLVFGVFVYASLGLEGLPSSQTPDVMQKNAKDAEDTIKKPENATQVLAAVTVPTGYSERVDDQQKPTLADAYVITHPPSPNYMPDGQRRLDPKLLAPEKVEAYSITSGLVYLKTETEEDAFAKEKNSELPKPEVKKVKEKKKTGFGSGGMSGMSSAPGYGSEDSAGGAMAGMPGMSSAGMSGMPGMAGMPGMGGMPGMEGMAGATGGVMVNPQDRLGVLAGPMSIVKSRSMIAVKAVVPWRKQWEEYRDKFSTAMGYNPQRDTPNYIWFNAERLEVTGDPQEELDWTKAKKINTKRVMDQLTAEGLYTWAPEVADPRYLYYSVLTFPVPPVVNRDPEKLALHSEVPKVNEAALAAMKAAKEKAKKKDTKKKTGEESDLPDTPGVPTADESGVAGGAAMPGMPGMTGGAMMPGMPGMSGGSMPGMPGMSSGGMPGMSGGAMMPGMPGMPGMSGMGSESAGMSSMGMAGMGGMSGYNADGSIGGYGSESSSGMSGYGGYGEMTGGMNVAPGPAVPYLLIRFFDMDVEPGKIYRYRVQVLVEDPNHPKFAQLEPSDRTLDDSVKTRLAEVAASEKSSQKQTRKYYLYTDFSPPSDPITVEIEPVSLAGQVLPLETGNAPDKTQDRIVLKEPEAKMMSVMWDAVRATDVAGVTNVFRGTFLNFKSKADAIHPVMLVFKRLEDYDFQTDRLVADIRGGEELPVPATSKDEPLLSPGQYALIDETGQIVVRSEFDDWDQFRKLSLPPPVVTIATVGDESESGNMPGMSSMPGYGAPAGGKKAKGKARGSSMAP